MKDACKSNITDCRCTSTPKITSTLGHMNLCLHFGTWHVVFSRFSALPDICCMFVFISDEYSAQQWTIRDSITDLPLISPFENKKKITKRCFTSTETVGLLGTGAQVGHLDFHTAPELWVFTLVGWALLYVHRNCRLIRDGSPGRPLRLSHSSWALKKMVLITTLV